MRPMRRPGVAKVIVFPSLAPPMKKLELISASGQKRRAAPVRARRYCTTLFQATVWPSFFPLLAGSDPPAVEVRASRPKPFPTARVGVAVAQQLPLAFLPVGTVPATKAERQRQLRSEEHTSEL